MCHQNCTFQEISGKIIIIMRFFPLLIADTFVFV